MASRMDNPRGDKPRKGKKVRVDFRRNRGKPRRIKDWTDQARQGEEHEFDAANVEHIVTKGDLSRKRTIIEGDIENDPEVRRGVVVAMRGLYANVDDGERIWPCTVRRVLRTRLIKDRHPVTTGDKVWFRPIDHSDGTEQEGVIEKVADRTGILQRKAGRRVHTIVANVDRAIIVSCAGEPAPKPHLIDRYIVASQAGEITPVICMNKIDLDEEGYARSLLELYASLGYETVITSAETGEGVEALRATLEDRASVIAGQSGVGKSSLLNAVQPDLNLRVGEIVEQTRKGRHTTTTATLIRLEMGGYVVDTPGVKSLDITPVPINEIETHFVEFADHIPHCKFADCSHRHETGCAVRQAVDHGNIDAGRYDSYARLFEEMADAHEDY